MSDLQVSSTSDWFSGSGKCRLFLRSLRPQRPRAVLAIVHGLGEHSGRYKALAEALADHGLAYYSFDLRGHGESEGLRGDVQDFGDYLNDVDAFLKVVRQREPSLRIFLMGHSLGGVIAVFYALAHQAELAGLIVASAPFQLFSPPGPLSLAGARFLSAIAPRIKISNDLNPAQLSNDPALPAEYLADPLIERQVTVKWATEFFSTYRRAAERAGELLLPVLVLHGEVDEIADVGGARAFYQGVRSMDKSLHTFPGLRHELYSELPENRADVFATLLSWLDARLA